MSKGTEKLKPQKSCLGELFEEGKKKLLYTLLFKLVLHLLGYYIRWFYS